MRTSRFAFAVSLPEARRGAQEIGFPCGFKAMMSSSGHGMAVVRAADGRAADRVEEAYAKRASTAASGTLGS